MPRRAGGRTHANSIEVQNLDKGALRATKLVSVCLHHGALTADSCIRIHPYSDDARAMADER